MDPDSRSDDEAALEDWLDFTDEVEQAATTRTWGLPEWAAVALGVAVVVGIYMLWPSGESRNQAEDLSALGVPSEFYSADVIRIEQAP